MDAGALTARSDDGYGHDFDFHLFDSRGETCDLPSLPLDRLSITVVDTETTGLDPDRGDEIIAIGAVRIVNGRILRQESFDSFVRPKREISEAARAIHGISGDMLRAEPPIEEVLPRLQKFVEDTVIVGHNVAFDMRFFAAAEQVERRRLLQHRARHAVAGLRPQLRTRKTRVWRRSPAGWACRSPAGTPLSATR